MGMAASQARYLALTSRMNDIEYQGQQINQQRTTLSSQINALYNSLLEMDVPTPPSTTDFKRTVYSGVNNATSFTLSNIVPTGNNKYSIDLNYQLSGNAFKKSSTKANLSPASSELYYKFADVTDYMYATEVTKYNNPSELNLTFEELEALSHKDETGKATDDDILVRMSVADYEKYKGSISENANCYIEEDGGIHSKPQDSLSSIEDKNNTYIYVKINVDDLLDMKNKDLAEYCGLTVTTEIDTEGNNEEKIGAGTPKNIYSANLVDSGSKHKEYSNYRTDGQIATAGLCVLTADNEEIAITTVEDLKKYLAQTDVQIVKRVYTPEGADKTVTNPVYDKSSSAKFQVGNMQVYNLSDEAAKDKIGASTLTEYINGIKHSFPEYAKLSDDEILDKFYVYFEPGVNGGSTKTHMIKKSDVGVENASGIIPNTTVYDFDESGKYTESKPTKDCQLEFDASGRITRVGIPDENGQVTFIDVSFVTETDEDAYTDAMNDYEYKKHTYDQQQQEINAKTSIIQAEDKNLELKLTRLDNERNAVNTELEAVKKVIQDNIDKGFKTFSG